MSTAGVVEYRWVQNDARLDAYCVTAVADGTREQVLSAFRAEPATETHTTFTDAFNGFPSPTYVLVGEVPGGVLAVEHNGWWGVRDEVAAAVSRGTTVASFYRNVNAVMAFLYAVDGQVVAMFDPLLEEVPPVLVERAVDLPFGVEQTEASAFALLERLTGIRFDEDWLTAPRARYDVPSGV